MYFAANVSGLSVYIRRCFLTSWFSLDGTAGQVFLLLDAPRRVILTGRNSLMFWGNRLSWLSLVFGEKIERWC